MKRAAGLRWLAGLALGVSAAVLPDPVLHVFDSTSLASIEQSHAGRPFILVFWATDCMPCRDELQQFQKARTAYERFDYVLVATDPPENRALVKSLLQATNTDRESWIFSGESPEKLRFSVDPMWGGEVPRSYFYDQASERREVSGTIDDGLLQAWIDRL